MAPNRNPNPTEGQKVDLGRNAPVTSEGPGAVDSGSLAAESAAFKSSNQVSSSDITSSEGKSSTYTPQEGSHRTSSNKTHATSGTGRGAVTGTENVDQAPSYVNSQFATGDKSGPHGKNITEDEGLSGKNASFTEYGTKGDPARLAEQKFEAANSLGANNVGGVGREKGIDGKTPFDALDAERPA